MLAVKLLGRTTSAIIPEHVYFKELHFEFRANPSNERYYSKPQELGGYTLNFLGL